MTKEGCTGGIYEYLYSHAQDAAADITVTSNSNVNMYLGCEAAGGGWSTTAGSIIRYNLVDGSGNWATFDYALHDAGDFDTITALWVQVVLVVAPERIITYDDGYPVLDTAYGYYSTAMTFTNLAYDHPGRLNSILQPFNLVEDIVIGSREICECHCG